MCSPAFPDPSDSALCPPHLQPLGWRRCLRWHVTSRSCRPRATARAGVHGASPIHLLVPNRADVASRSSRNRIPSLTGASPKGSRSSTRRVCPSVPFGARLASGPDTDAFVDSAAEAAAPSVSIGRRSPQVSPCGTPSRQECPHGTSAENRQL